MAKVPKKNTNPLKSKSGARQPGVGSVRPGPTRNQKVVGKVDKGGAKDQKVVGVLQSNNAKKQKVTGIVGHDH